MIIHQWPGVPLRARCHRDRQYVESLTPGVMERAKGSVRKAFQPAFGFLHHELDTQHRRQVLTIHFDFRPRCLQEDSHELYSILPRDFLDRYVQQLMYYYQHLLDSAIDA
jgi:hypothetical protein